MTQPKPRRTLAYHTATVRNAILTRLPDALMGGALKARHVAQRIEIQERTFTSAHWPRDFDGLHLALPFEVSVPDVFVAGHGFPPVRVCSLRR